MKCLVLAGGPGDRLWPLSRKNYPKQFMEIQKGRSMFQETIARNIPFCDEFYIISNIQYRYIIEGQLQAFQGLKYRVFLEQEMHKTASPTAIVCLCCNASEQILLVSTDHMIDNGDYKAAILQAVRYIQAGYLSLLGVPAMKPHTGYGYIQYNGEESIRFIGRVSESKARDFVSLNNYYWDCGIMAMSAGDYLHELKKFVPGFLDKCQKIKDALNMSGKFINMSNELFVDIPSLSIGEAISIHTDKLRMVKAEIEWQRILDLQSIAAYYSQSEGQIIEEHCTNVSIINQEKDKAIVANSLKNIMVVNTPDAIFITNTDSTSSIKSIMKKHGRKQPKVFQESNIYYEPWGMKEILSANGEYSVKKITVYPLKSLAGHTHLYRDDHWSIVNGAAIINLDGQGKKYICSESVHIPSGTLHQLSNQTTEDVVFIETSIGDISGYEDISESHTVVGVAIEEDIVKLEPAFKDSLWGGTRLRDQYGKQCDYAVIAESWELSTHPDGQSIVADGLYKGMLFGEYLNAIGKEKLGWKAQSFERFPLLIKFIDARKCLSIQVHPDDEYALPVENEYGKNEMWYIIDCTSESYLYIGLKKELTKAELAEKIESNTLEDILNKVPVRKGQTIFIEAGTIHAIGPGILLCEIQQNSNATYRLYDFGRKDKYGELRKLHIKKALDVVSFTNKKMYLEPASEVITETGYTIQLLGQCKYFAVYKYMIKENAAILVEQTSFISIVILEGTGEIKVNNYKKQFTPGDSYFVPAGKKTVLVSGSSAILVARV